MRIISGKYGGRRISPPANMPHTRPTTDIAKEGLFNILQSRMSFDDIEILDLFGGTGCISYELASRGASKLTIIEKDPIMQGFIQKNISMLQIEGAQVLKLDVFAYLNTCTISYELASRGAGKLTIIEKDPIMQAFIQKNIGVLNIEGAQVLKLDVFAYLNSCTSAYDFIFAGPPYALGTIDELPKIIVAKKLIKPGGFFVLEHTPRNDYKNFEGYSFQRNYGTTIFSFFVAT